MNLLEESSPQLSWKDRTIYGLTGATLLISYVVCCQAIVWFAMRYFKAEEFDPYTVHANLPAAPSAEAASPRSASPAEIADSDDEVVFNAADDSQLPAAPSVEAASPRSASPAEIVDSSDSDEDVFHDANEMPGPKLDNSVKIRQIRNRNSLTYKVIKRGVTNSLTVAKAHERDHFIQNWQTGGLHQFWIDNPATEQMSFFYIDTSEIQPQIAYCTASQLASNSIMVTRHQNDELQVICYLSAPSPQ